MNSRQQLIIQLGCDYVAATVGRKHFDLLTAEPDKVADACFVLATAVANRIRQAVHENAGPDDTGVILPPQRH